jgi:hypothetical protein
MILDDQNTLSDLQAVTATAISANVIDLGPLGGIPTANLTRDIGTGNDLYFYCVVTTTFTAGGAATLTLTIESDDNVGLASPTVHFTSAVHAVASLVAGFEIAKVELPPALYQRYLGARYTIATGPMTAGNLSAYIATGIEQLRYYRDARPDTVT